MEYIKLGKITKPFGLKGELKVYSDSDFVDERFQVGNTLWGSFKDGMREIHISSVRMQKGQPIITVDDKADINQINDYLGVELFIKASDLMPLEEDEFYVHELIDKEVYNTDNDYLGKVKDVLVLPAHPILEVYSDVGKKILIPFVKAFVVKVQDERIIIKEIEGLR